MGVATRPRDGNGFGYSAQFAAEAEGISRVKQLFCLLAETDDIHPAWGKLVLSNEVLGKTAYDARLVAAMQVHNFTISAKSSHSIPAILSGMRVS